MFKNQKGAGHVVAILAVVLVLAIAGAAYYVWQQRSGSTNSVLGLGQSYKCEYDDKDLCKFLGKFMKSTQYTVTSSSGNGDQKMDYKITIDGEEKSETVMATAGKENYHVISIKNATYTKDYADNKWWKQVSEEPKDDVKDSVTFEASDSTEEEANKEPAPKTEYKKVGKEACGKLNCFKYQVITAGQEGTEFIWFDDKDYLMRKYVVTDRDGVSNTSEYSYDKISVKEPSPIKEGTPTPAGFGTVPTEQDLQNYDMSQDAVIE